MLALALWLSVAAVPLDEVEVDRLTLSDAKMEDVRLSYPPTRVGPAVMLGLGAIALPTGILATFFTVDEANHQSKTGFLSGLNVLFYGAIGFVTVIIAAAGVALAITGGVLLSVNGRKAEEAEARQAQVRDRIA